MRIHFNKVKNNKPIFGAMIPTITEFKAHGVIKGKKVPIFNSTEFGAIYCTFDMLERILERYRVNGQDTRILTQGIL